MKTFFRFIKYTVYGALLSIIFACSDDFLNDTPVLQNLGREYYPIYISPDGNTDTYPIYCPNAGNAKFSISHAPEWLNISDVSEQFINDMAYITCSASTNSEYDKYGAYNVIMTIEVEGIGKYPVMIFYINEGMPTIEIENNNLNLDDYGEQYLRITNKGEGILMWKIVSYPEWVSLNLDMMNNPLYYYDAATVTVKYNNDYPLMESILSGKFDNKLTGKIIIASNDKKKPEVTVDVSMILGEPEFYCNIDDNEIDFGRGDVEKLISFTNYGSGILVWQIEDYPEWITFSQTQGYVGSFYYSNEITVTCDRSNLPEGANHATFTVRTNDINNPVKRINVKCRNGSHNSENIRDISGTVTDAWFDKHSDLLYVSTKQPNRMMVYDAKTKTTTYEIELPNAPNCFSLSDDKRRIAVGHGGKISFIDMSRHTIEKTVEVESAVFDIEWGADDWCCYTPVTTAQYERLKWINAVSDEQYETVVNGMSSIYGGTIIRKIPNRNYMIATRPDYSPSGIVVFDSQTREHINYFHESIDMFWFSEDGNYMFDSYHQVYRTSALTAENISPIAQLDFNAYVKWIDHNSASNSLWVIRRNYYYDTDYKIWQMEANDFTVVNTFFYDDYYLTTFNGMRAEYQVEAHYVFANSAGSEVIVIKNLIEELQGNAWSLEHVTVNPIGI